jgi:hypothetical protein
VSGFPSGALSAALAWLRGISVAIDQGRTAELGPRVADRLLEDL